MENITNQISYLKGLMEGLKFDENSSEGKVLTAVVSVLEEISDSIDDLYDYQDEIAEQLELIDDDLAAVEDVLLDCEECDCDCDCDDDQFYDLECPSCNETVCIDEELLCSGDDIICPNCDEKIEIDFDSECECGCDFSEDE